jgi:hypothetical protein
MLAASKRVYNDFIELSTKNYSISYIVDELKAGNNNLSPDYQRDFKWILTTCSNLIDSVMKRKIIPTHYNYKLQNKDKKPNEKYKYECIDGHHRLKTIYHFKNSEYIKLPNGKELLVYYYNKENNIYLFYEKNENTKNFTLENDTYQIDYFTEEEKERFDDFILDFREITTPLTYNDRSDIFTRLQMGTPNRNSDFDKNRLECPLINEFNNKRIVAIYGKQYIDLLTTSPVNYTLYHKIRLFAIYKTIMDSDNDSDLDDNIDNEEELLSIVLTGDSKYKKMISNKYSWVNKEDEVKPYMEGFADSLKEFFDLLEKTGLTFTPYRLLSVYCDFLKNPYYFEGENQERKIKQLKRLYEKESKSDKNLWLRKDDKNDESYKNRCKKYFLKCMEENDNYDYNNEIENVSKHKRQYLSPKERNAIWKRDFQDKQEGQCWLCEKEVTKKKWQCGHIVAVAKGGTNDQDNLVVMHKKCNLNQGTENAYEYKKKLVSI